MKSFRMLKLPAMLLGVGAAVVILSPACKAQESSPDQFTDTGVQDVYQHGPAKPAAAKAGQTAPAAQAQNQRSNSAASLKNTGTRNSSLAVHPNSLAIAEKRKIAARKQEKP
jgi:hypothetical protein